MRLLTLILLSLCLGATNAPLSLRERVAAMRAVALTNPQPAQASATNITLGWIAQTNDVCLYSTTNVAIQFPTGWRNDGIFGPGATNATLPIKDRYRFWAISGYDVGTALMSFTNRWMP